MSALIELAERCEAATGPSVSLDNLIDEAVGEGCSCQVFYTASVDAALTLVPEGWLFRSHQRFPTRDFWCSLTPDNWMSGNTRGGAHDTSLALAICAAALRARAVQTPSSDTSMRGK